MYYSYITVVPSCSKDSAWLVSYLRDDEHADGSVSRKVKALEADLFKYSVQIKT